MKKKLLGKDNSYKKKDGKERVSLTMKYLSSN